jgi:hypothetical protein
MNFNDTRLLFTDLTINFISDKSDLICGVSGVDVYESRLVMICPLKIMRSSILSDAMQYGA